MSNPNNPPLIPMDPALYTADAQDIEMNYRSQLLTISFKNAREEHVCFACRDTLAFRWQEAEYFLEDGERDDSSYEVERSPWIAEHKAQGMTPKGISFHHYKLNFNAAGILEILCSRIEKQQIQSQNEP